MTSLAHLSAASVAHHARRGSGGVNLKLGTVAVPSSTCDPRNVRGFMPRGSACRGASSSSTSSPKCGDGAVERVSGSDGGGGGWVIAIKPQTPNPQPFKTLNPEPCTLHPKLKRAVELRYHTSRATRYRQRRRFLRCVHPGDAYANADANDDACGGVVEAFASHGAGSHTS
jgi:hypothetical protein